MQLLHTPAVRSEARNRRSEMKSHNSPWTSVGCGLILLTVFLFGAPANGQMVASPSTVSFGSVEIGNSASQSVVLNNTGDRNLTISQATVSGTGFSVGGLNIPLTLASGQSVSFTTTFAPQSSGSISGSVSLEYSRFGGRHHANTITVSLSVTGKTSGQLTASPSSMNFSNVQVGSSQTQSATLTNSGASSLTVSQATLTGSGFTLSGLVLPLTLSAGQSASFTVMFAPTGSGAASGSIAVTSNGSNPTLSIPLSGTGVTQGALTANPASVGFGNVQDGSN